MLVLCDLDKTLIDESYGIHGTNIHGAIARAIGRGHVIGLNSDTPLPPLKVWYRDFGMNGPIIAERGALVWEPKSDTIVPTGTAPEDVFRNLRDRVLDELASHGEFDAILCDPATVIRQRRYRVHESRRVILASSLRQFSLHFAPREITSGGAYFYLPEVLERIREALLLEIWNLNIDFEIDWDVNAEYCLLILHAVASRKRVGVRKLLECIGDQEVVMIGDSLNDHLDLPNVQQWAVGNASDDYKAVCSRIAVGSYASGVAELLEGL